MSRLPDVVTFYALLDRLKQKLGGFRSLATLTTFRDWPRRGVYFFFEPTEGRQESGDGPRVVRVGTHALNGGSQSTLRQRLTHHRGQLSGGGNHRGSIFRLLVGHALMARGDVAKCGSWGVKGDIRLASVARERSRGDLVFEEAPIERAVSDYLAAMPFLWLNLDDEPGPSSLRGIIERNVIALLSNYQRPGIDPPSDGWLGRVSHRSLVRESGLWNQRHVNETHDLAFLAKLETAIAQTGLDRDRL